MSESLEFLFLFQGNTRAGEDTRPAFGGPGLNGYMALVRTVEHMKMVALRPQTLNGRVPDLQGVIDPSEVGV